MSDEVTFVELSVKLSTGQFESRVNVPISATEEQRKKFVEAWFALLKQALEIAKPTDGASPTADTKDGSSARQA